ncbi:M20 family metallo-hydrolase [Fulvivirga sediminis]|uniref:M20 family metallo-hydrolase n=1 Tax=Fulvivirga sediminis TaxID=2803949 RepID=A0A937FCP5_9BACT|nr:M20 family metallo-hydrolase [Fulvivirga sediminis]MBL3658123.1 M20 family metallo-hydrolase [Fulvivirga sediminis]
MTIKEEAISLLKSLISIPSFSREEDKTGDLLEQFLQEKDIEYQRSRNNIWAKNRHFSTEKPTILLNSHHDTVKPNSGYTRDPHAAEIMEGKLYGLGSNDAGGPLVSLLATFLHFYEQENLTHNLIYAATAEEEVSGKDGIESILPLLGTIDLAIVGEPTSMEVAVSEKGLMVLDCVAKGKAGHAARNEGENAIYKAVTDIEWFRKYEFEKVSPTLGPVHMNVTQVNAGTQHNVVPDECHFVVDIRLTDAYSHEGLLEIIKENTLSEVTPRSTRLKPSGISMDHPLVKKAIEKGMKTYGSPTMSDQALINAPSIKLGPGDSKRSHSADEFIYVHQIEEGIDTYIDLLERFLKD